jgi:phosphatidyl-myo-inositol alpha-mannosyltransferase
MVLTEAFAAGTPVVASDIAGYRDVVADGRDGLLVPRGDATRLAETLRDLALDPARNRALAAEAGRSA